MPGKIGYKRRRALNVKRGLIKADPKHNPPKPPVKAKD